MGSRLHGNDGGGLGSWGWVPVCTGTTVVDWGAGDGFPFARERRWWIREPGMGSRLHGNDGGGWLVSLRRTYRRADTWVRPYGWSRAHPPHRIPHPHRAGEGGFQTRPYGSRATRCGVALGSHAHSFGGDSGQAPPSPVEGEGVRAPFHSHYSVVLSGLGH